MCIVFCNLFKSDCDCYLGRSSLHHFHSPFVGRCRHTSTGGIHRSTTSTRSSKGQQCRFSIQNIGVGQMSSRSLELATIGSPLFTSIIFASLTFHMLKTRGFLCLDTQFSLEQMILIIQGCDGTKLDMEVTAVVGSVTFPCFADLFISDACDGIQIGENV